MDNLRGLYKEYLDGNTDIKEITRQEARKMISDGTVGHGRYVYKQGDLQTALYGLGNKGALSNSYESTALSVGYLMDANYDQLELVNNVLRAAKEKGQSTFENVEDALLSPSPDRRGNATSAANASRIGEIKAAFQENNGVYDPVHSVYIDPTVTDACDKKCITFYDVTVDDIEECMAHGTKFLDEVPEQIHVVNGSPVIAEIPVDGPDDPIIDQLAATIGADERWCDVTGLDIGGFEHFKDVLEKNYQIEKANDEKRVEAEPSRDLWRDGMITQVLGQMDAIDGNGLVGEQDASSVLCDMFREASGDWMVDAGKEVLETYAQASDAEQQGMANMFYALTGETFDTFLTEASRACEETLEPYREEHSESLDEMMSAKSEEAEIGEDGTSCEKDDVDR